VTLAARGTLRRGEVLGLNREDVDLRAGTVRAERSLHEFYAGRLEPGPTKNGDPRKVYMPSSVMPALRTTCGAASGPKATPPSSSAPRGAGCVRTTFGSSGRPHVGGSTSRGCASMTCATSPPPCSPPRRRHEGDHEPRWLEVGRHGGALRARIRGARCAARTGPQRLHDQRQRRATHERTLGRSARVARATGVRWKERCWTYRR
jgi:integrase